MAASARWQGAERAWLGRGGFERLPASARLVVVWLEATHKVRLGGVEHVVELGELHAEGVDDALELVGFDLLLAAGRGLLLGEERAQHLVVRKLHEHEEVARQWILILVQPPDGRVGDLTRKVRHLEAAAAGDALDGRECATLFLRVVKLLCEARIRTLWHHALLREQRPHTRLRHFEEVNQLLVVGVGDSVGGDPILLIGLERLQEDGFGEERLQLLVCKVDAELLERVGLEDLKAEDVDDANDARVLVGNLRGGGGGEKAWWWWLGGGKVGARWG